MTIKYYKTDELCYSNRNRYRDINSYTADATEVQKKVVLGNGAKTQIKTSVNNICNYVTIDNTRWYVTGYNYLNGAQVVLDLQRDVIGEFGINNCIGKIERGYTNTFLKYKKELSLNQVLKKRIPLRYQTDTYRNYTVNTHTGEKWGILYLVKPTGIDPNTGEAYPDTVNINIPGFEPEIEDWEPVDNGTKFNLSNFIGTQNVNINIVVRCPYRNQSTYTYKNVYISFSYRNSSWSYSITMNTIKYTEGTAFTDIWFVYPGSNIYSGSDSLIYQFFSQLAQSIISENNISTGLSFPVGASYGELDHDYDGIAIYENEKYYRYTVSVSTEDSYGNVNKTNFRNKIKSYANTKIGDSQVILVSTSADSVTLNSEMTVGIGTINKTEITGSEAGQLTINTNVNLVDEPYVILAFPLYEVTITGKSSTYIIDDVQQAFNVFNSVIQYLSGENAYLVDAQIFPYCPDLTSVASEINGFPFFQIKAATYTREVSVNLYPFSDIKKEYITHKYRITSPDQTGEFDFDFYDYTNYVNDSNGINQAELTLDLKISLKPFSIIAAAVVRPDGDSLVGIQYATDMRGAKPSNNGFECSLASNAFETYKRQNSNYQQIFALQQEQLSKEHEVERVNEVTSGIVNTISATAMGAIAGGSVGVGPISKGVGAGVGGAAAGAIVGTAQGVQYSTNEELRNYEEYLQKQNFDLQIGTIKALPNTVSRISTFTELLMQEFYFVIEQYECTQDEMIIVDNYISRYGYSLGVIGNISDYVNDGWFIRSSLISSNLLPALHNVAAKELMGGIYIYE